MNSLTHTTVSLKPADVEKKWIVVDAENAIVGRLASFIAMRLRGKHRPDYTPHVDCGDYVVVINADKVKFTGRKLKQKTYYWHTGYPGGIKERTAEKVLGGNFPERILEKAVERMLPKESPLARAQMTHLRIFAGPEHAHAAQRPEEILFGDINPKNKVRAQRTRRRRVGHPLSNSGGINTAAVENLPSALTDANVESSTPKAKGIGLKEQFDLGEVAGEIERFSMALDPEDLKGRQWALLELASLLPTLDVDLSLTHPRLRRALRGIPDRLLQALAENLSSSEVAKSAALAIAACVRPEHYRDQPVVENELRALQDFQEILGICKIDSFSTVDLGPSGSHRTTLEAQLWNGLPFTLAGEKPKLAKSKWLKADGGIGVKLDGAQMVEVKQTERLGDGQLASVRVTIEPRVENRDDAVVVYLTHAERVFDRYLFDAYELFPGSV